MVIFFDVCVLCVEIGGPLIFFVPNHMIRNKNTYFAVGILVLYRAMNTILGWQKQLGVNAYN